jgi:chromosome segregation ATPase
MQTVSFKWQEKLEQ